MFKQTPGVNDEEMTGRAQAEAGPSILAAFLGLSLALEALPVTALTAPDFASEVLPVLERRCFACHGPLRQRGDLRLDSRPAMLIGGARGAAIVPGDVEASLLVQAIRREGDVRMPPPRPLDDGEREVLEAWVAAGARWPLDHGAGGSLDAGPAATVAAREVPSVLREISGPGAPLSFTRDVRPILSDNCYECHGPDAAVRQAGLRLDVADGALAVLPSGRRAVVPGSLEQSQLFRRIAAVDQLDRMPPPHAGSDLSAEEIDVLGRFILQGAAFEEHWAYQAPQRPTPPVQEADDWSRGDVDRFVFARLQAEGLHPSPEADRRTLARRLALDLTGLPPTPTEVDAFVEDRREDAYERLIDRLLDSERYGEHMARFWLDAARYADTNGYHIDNERVMWRWRDWVIEAFNRNQPFDEFTIEQLAGDLLPDPRPDQLLATGFNRNHMINFEGGAIPEEYRVQYVFDRTDTTATVWMGLTVGCAKCHDHKFDPISQREYYEFSAFFNTVDEVGLDGSRGNANPQTRTPDRGQQELLEEVDAELEPLVALLDDQASDAVAAQAEWQAEWERRLAAKWRHVEPLSFRSEQGAEMTLLEDGSLQVSGSNPDTDVYVIQAEVDLDRITALRLEALRDPERPSLGIGRADNGSLVVTEVEVEVTPLAAGGPTEVLDFVHAWADHSLPALPIHLAIDGDPATGWSADYPGSKTARTAVFVVGAGAAPHPGGARLRITLRQELADAPQRNIRRFRLSLSSAPEAAFPGLEASSAFAPLAPFAERLREYEYLLGLPAEQRTQRQEDRIRRLFRRGHWAPWRANEERYAELVARRLEIEADVPTTMIMREMDAPRPTFMLRRGEYDQQLDEVKASTPSFLPPLPPGLPRNRLGLASWLVDGKHPLTARVAVNRLWQRFFGRGLVATSGDFGSQGEWPSHPELLDWLATEFVRLDWDLKALQKTILLSSTYRQTSRASAELFERDPENRLLARASGFRLDAEVIRDSALAVAGLLVEKLGGPSVKPYQPPGLWREIGYESRGRFTAGEFVQDEGEGLYRRSLYTFWKRTVPPPNMLVFDAPNRETCVVERSRSNTPLQALVLMNDPQFVEAARALATRLFAVASDVDRVDALYRLVLARSPTGIESEALLALVRDLRFGYGQDVRAAAALLRVGEVPVNDRIASVDLAAWTVAASAVLNLDEAVTRR